MFFNQQCKFLWPNFPPNGRSTQCLAGNFIILAVDRFYIALFSALQQTHCASFVILNE